MYDKKNIKIIVSRKSGSETVFNFENYGAVIVADPGVLCNISIDGVVLTPKNAIFVKQKGRVIIRDANGDDVVILDYGNDASSLQMHVSDGWCSLAPVESTESAHSLANAAASSSSSEAMADLSSQPNSAEPTSTSVTRHDAATGAGFSLGSKILAGIALVGGGVGVALASGGGDSGSSTPSPTPTPTPTTTTLSGSFMAGPVVSGGTLTATAYDAAGNVLGISAIDDDGKYHFTINYKGTILVKVTDNNLAQPDYFDEASGKAVNLAASLRAIITVDGATDVAVNVTPLTELVVRQLNITSNATSAIVSSQINTLNISIAKLFGLGSVDVTTLYPEPIVTGEGAVNAAANIYGNVLALLSGVGAGNLESSIKFLEANTTQTNGTVVWKADALVAVERAFANAAVLVAQKTGVMATDLIKFLENTDIAPPQAPVASLHQDTGESSGDQITSNGDVDVSGILNGGSWEYSTDGVTWTQGSGSAIASAGLKDGIQSVQIRQSDATGKISAPTVVKFTLDTISAAPTLALASDTGASNGDKITSNGAVNVTGVEDGAEWQYSVDGGTTWIHGSGSTIAPSAFKANQENTVQIKQTDKAGNVSIVESLTFTLDAAAPNTTVKSVHLSNDSGTSSSDFVTQTAQQTIIGTLSAGLAAGDILYGSVDNGATWTDITSKVSGTAITWSGATLSGSSTILFKIADAAGNESAATGSQSYVLDTTAPTQTIGSVHISNDSGTSSSDFITKNAAQTITGTLSAALDGGDILYGSVDNGVTWTDITKSVTGTAISWDGATLSGSSNIVFKISDLAGNDSATTGSQSYVLDTTAPMQTVGSVHISNDSGTSSSDFITKNAAQTITGTLSAALAAGDILYGSVDNGATWTDITKSVTGTAISWTGATLSGSSTILFKIADAAGNDSATTGIQSYVLDTTAPTQTVGSVHISNDSGTSSSDFITKNAAQTITGTLSAALSDGDILYGSVDNGVTWTDITSKVSGTAISWDGATLSGSSNIVFKISNAAGNDSATTGSQSYVLDTTAPAQTIGSVHISNDSGTSSSDFITKNAAQTITGTLSAALADSDILYGSVDNGVTWTDITGKVSGTAITWSGATLSGSSTILFKIADAAGNESDTTGSRNYVLDTTAPMQTVGSVHISNDSGTSSSDFITKNAAQTITGTLSAALSDGDILYGSVDNGATWTDITKSVTGTAISWDGATLSGSSNIVFKISDLAGNDSAATGSQSYVLDTTAPTQTIGSVHISNDSGTSSSDFITKNAAQTITGTLSAALSDGDILYGSVDNGVTWTDITGKVSGTAISWDGATLSGSSSILFKISDAAGNDSAATGSQSYVLDTTAPTQTIGSVHISNDSGTSSSDFITKTASQTITGTLSAALDDGDILYGSVDNGVTWTDITSKVSGTAISWTDATLSGSSNILFKISDAAGNDSATTGSQSYVLDTTAPTQTIGSVHISNDSGTSSSDFITKNAAQTITGTLSAALDDGDILYGSVDNGATWTDITSKVSGTAISWTDATLSGSSNILFKISDAAGNDSATTGSQSYVLDTTAPMQTVGSVHISNDSGTSSSDFITKNAAQTITGTLSAALSDGDILYGSVDNGVTWIDITGKVSGTAITWSGATLSGSSTILFKIADAAGNDSAATGSQSYVLDTTAPTQTVGSVHISNDSGTSSSDFITNNAAQTITGTLSAALADSDILYGSVDNGVTWTDITGKVSGTAITWTGATLSGSSNIVFKISDLAGNESAATGSQSYVLDTTAPTQTVGSVHLSNDSGTSSSDFITKNAAQTITGALSAALAAGDILYGSVDNGVTWTDITSKVSGTAISWTDATLSGSSNILFKISDAAGNDSATTGSQSYVLDTTAPMQTVGSVHISNDSGTSSSDFITKNAAQTITGTLSAALDGGDILYGSVDNGVTWTDITGKVSGTAISWDGATLSGSSSILFKISDAAGNDSATTGSQSYVLDTTAPMQTVGSVHISNDSGTSSSDFITKNAAQTITGTLSAALSDGDILYGSVDNGVTWIDITGKVSGTAITWSGATLSGSSTILFKIADAAGNDSAATGSQSYVLDTTAPTQTVGSVHISNDSGTSSSDFITNNAAQTITGTLSAALADSDILYGSVDNGVTWTDITGKVSGTAITWTGATLSGSSNILFKISNAAGNDSATTGSQSYVLDTTAPTQTVGSVHLSNDSGTSSSDFITKNAAQTITGALSAALAAGDILYGSVDNGVTWTDITSKVSGTAISWTDATLSGSSNILFKISDAAGNDSATTGSQSYVLDTTAPMQTVGSVHISNDSGTSSSDFITKNAAQTITGTLSAALDGGDILYGSVDNGVTWTDITGKVSGTAISWDGATLSGSSSILFKISDAAGNDSATTGSQSYVLDTTAPMQTVGSVHISNDSGTSSSDFITKNAAQTITGTLSAALADSDILYGSVDNGATWTDITGKVSGTAITWSGATLSGSSTILFKIADAAGNESDTTGSRNYVLDTTAPMQTVGSVHISNDSGTSSSDFITKNAAQTITGTLSAALSDGDILYGSVDNGVTWTDITGKVSGTAITWSGATLSGSSTILFKITDAAGNESATTGSQSYVLDTTAPMQTVGSVHISNDSGTSSSDFITKNAAQTITGTLSAALSDGDILYGSVDNGVTWIDITGKVSGTAITWSGATLSGSSTILFKIADAAGNESDTTGSRNYVLDTTAPMQTVGSVHISNDSGTSSSDFITKNAAQTITGTLSAALSDGDILYGSVDNGVTWIDITGKVSGTAITWSGATLSGSSTILFKIADAAGNESATTGSQSYVLDTTAPTQTIGSVHISNDSGTSSSDFITKNAAQTITGTLSAALDGGDILYGSVDNGATWTDITGKVSGTAISWDGATLSGSSSILFKISDAAGNDSAATGSQSYVLDTTAPTQTIGSVHISNDSGTSSSDFITKNAAQTITGTLSAALSDGDILYGSVDNGVTWTDITGKVSGTAISWTDATLSGSSAILFKISDAAGNDSATTGSQSYVLDTTAPTQTVGSVHISNDSGTSSSDFITKNAAQTITGTLSAALADSDILYGSVDNGATWTDITNSVSVTGTAISWGGATLSGSSSILFKITDAAGNDSATTGSQSYVLDTTAPTATMSSNEGGYLTTESVLVQSSEAGMAYLVKDGSAWTSWEEIINLADDQWNGVSLEHANNPTRLALTGLAEGGYHLYTVDAAGNLSAQGAGIQVGSPIVYLSAIEAGQGGFVINGHSAGDFSGFCVSSAGDVNGDGLGDLIVGAPGRTVTQGNEVIYEGKSYVVFGTTAGTAIDLVNVAAGKGGGFVINGENVNGRNGRSVSSAGDVNGDGLADLLVGAPYSIVNGKSYVVYGTTTTAPIELSKVNDGEGGFAFTPGAGMSVSAAGDVNGDGYADLIIASYSTNPSIDRLYAGHSYVIFGSGNGMVANLSSIEAGTGGFVINGQCAMDMSGVSVSSAGDVNGDGLSDLIVGAYGADNYTGKSYVVFGKTDGAKIELASIAEEIGGFVINGESVGDYNGCSVSGACDVNGDGLADLIVGAYGADNYTGKSYVIFGKTDTAAINLSAMGTEQSGFVINGQGASDCSGQDLSVAGDVNGDGLADLIVGAYYADTSGGATAGKSYVVFGKTGIGAIDLSAVALGQGGFVINGECADDWSGIDVSAAGDVNGDGLADLIVGAYKADPTGGADAGKSYVIFGSTSGAFIKSVVDWMGASGNDTWTGSAITAQTAVGGAGNDALISAGAADVLYGGAGNDTIVIGSGMITALQSAYGSGGNNTQLARIDGGSGSDTLRLDGGAKLDLTQIANQAAGNPTTGSRISSIEKIDLATDINANILTLSARDVVDMAGMNLCNSSNGWVDLGPSVSRHQVVIDGGANDVLALSDSAWVKSSLTVTHDATQYAVYDNNLAMAELLVKAGMSVNLL